VSGCVSHQYVNKWLQLAAHGHSSQLNTTNKEQLDRHNVNTGLTRIEKKNPESEEKSTT